MRREVALAHAVLVRGERHLHVVDRHGVELDVGRHAHALDGDVAGREVLGDGELEGGLLGRDLGEDELHAALAESLLAHDQRAVVVLERAGDDLARARAAAVHEHDERVHGLGAGGLGALLLTPLGEADGGDDGAVEEELVGDARGLLEQAARVAAEIEHEPADGAAGLELLERGVQLGRARLLERLEPHVADAVVQAARLDRADLDDLAAQLEGLGVLPAAFALARDPDRDLGAGLAAEAPHGVVERHVERRLVVDLHDAVEPLDLRAPRRRVGHGVHHGQHLIADGDHDAQPAERPRRGEVHLLVVVGAHEDRVRVERVQHAVARRVLDLAEIDLGPAEVLLEEREHLTQARGHVPGALHVVDAELLLVVLDADRDLLGVVGQDDDLRHVALDVVERREEHLLGLHAVGIHVLVADHLEGLVDRLETREVVRTLLHRAGDGERRLEATPQAAGVVSEGEERREGEGAEHDQHLPHPLEDPHGAQYKRPRAPVDPDARPGPRVRTRDADGG